MKTQTIIRNTLLIIPDGTDSFPTSNRRIKMKKIQASEFFSMMHEMTDAWNQGNARKAADYYTERALIEFCGGYRFTSPVRIHWRFLTFNENEQIGYGEYVFHQIHVSDSSAHVIKKYSGIAHIQIHEGRITSWREFRI